MDMTFTKLFKSIVTSTIWNEPDATRLVWITLLVMADQHGEVPGTIPGLANLARVDVDACKAAIDTLMSPDEYSRTKDNEGRRIEEIDGGWRILNHARYRYLASQEHKKAQAAERQRRKRARDKENA